MLNVYMWMNLNRRSSTLTILAAGFFVSVATTPVAFGQNVVSDEFQPTSLFDIDFSLGDQKAELADLDGDGLSDLIVESWVDSGNGSSVDSRVEYYLNNGTKVPFGYEYDYLYNVIRLPSPTLIQEQRSDRGGNLLVTDVNGDGRVDILAGNQPPRLYLNSGTDSLFGAGAEVERLDLRNGKLIDLDGDGDLDQLSTMAGGGIEMSLNQGDPSSVQLSEPVAVSNNRSLASFVVGDINDDGSPDIVAGSEAGSFFILNSGGIEPFSRGSVAFSAGINRVANEVFDLVDIDGDGDLDLFLYEILAQDGGRYPQFLLNNATDGLFSSSEAMVVGGEPRSDCIQHLVADANSDGAVDLLINDCSRQKQFVFVNEGSDLPFAIDSDPIKIQTDESHNVAVEFLASADIDNDDDVDIVAKQRWNNDPQTRFMFMLNNDFRGSSMPSLQANADLASEDSGRVDIVLTLDRTLSYPVSVELGTINGTAIQGQDFYGTFEELEFAAGETQKIVSIVVLEDELMEPDEYFYARVAFADGVNVEQSLLKVTISDSNIAPIRSISIADAQAQEADGKIDFALFLDGPSSQPISVYAATKTVPGGATPGQDFYGRSQLITFAPGETRQTFSVTLLEDGIDEPSERLKARIYRSDTAEIGRAEAFGYIDDVDPPTVSFAREVIGSRENVIGYFTSVRIGGGPPRDEPVTVQLASKKRTADPGRDYYGMFETLTIMPDEDEVNVWVEIIDDTESELLEQFEIRLFNPSPGLKLGDIKTQVVNITDDD